MFVIPCENLLRKASILKLVSKYMELASTQDKILTSNMVKAFCNGGLSLGQGWSSKRN